MEVFLTLLSQLLPLYLLIFLGFFSSRVLGVDRKSISKLLIYILTPVVILYGVSVAKLNWQLLFLPLLTFLLSVSVALFAYYLGKKVWGESSLRNIFAFTSGTGNTGYFGLPVVLVLFDESIFSVAVFSMLGFVLYENSLGFYLTAKGNFSTKESLRKIAGLPSLYAFFLGLILNVWGVNVAEFFGDSAEYFKGAYSLLGMMIIGMGIGTFARKFIDWKFLSMTFFMKFLLWPTVMLGVILTEMALYNNFAQELRSLLLLMSVVPLAANTVAFATELDVHPEKAAFAVISSTVFAVVYIPFVLGLFESTF